MSDPTSSNILPPDQQGPSAVLPFREEFINNSLVSLLHPAAQGARPTDCCPICYEDIDTSDEGLGKARIILNCGHMYHNSCIQPWFSMVPPGGTGSCPYDRGGLFIVPSDLLRSTQGLQQEVILFGATLNGLFDVISDLRARNMPIPDSVRNGFDEAVSRLNHLMTTVKAVSNVADGFTTADVPDLDRVRSSLQSTRNHITPMLESIESAF